MATKQRKAKRSAGSPAAPRAKATRAKAGRAPKAPSRFLPKQRWARALIYVALVLGYMAILWYLVFPWVDRTFINQPAV